jgi:acyl carrier protein
VGSASAVRLPGLAEKLPRIATDLCDSKQIVAAVEAHRLRASGFDRATDAGDLPQTLEGRLLGLWRTSIGNPRIGPNDNFFDAGGTSLKAVRTVAAIRRELHLPLSVINLFECPTVRLLADKLTSGKAGGASAREAMERGARRIPPPRRRT